MSLIHSRSSKCVRFTSSMAEACVETNQPYIDPRTCINCPQKRHWYVSWRAALCLRKHKDKLYDRKGDTSSRLDIESMDDFKILQRRFEKLPERQIPLQTAAVTTRQHKICKRCDKPRDHVHYDWNDNKRVTYSINYRRIQSNAIQLYAERQTHSKLSLSLQKQKLPQILEMRNIEGFAQGKDNQIIQDLTKMIIFSK